MTTQAALGILGRSKYISLTTFRKNGTPVATPVWVVRDGDSLRVITGAESSKAKRVRNNPAVTVAPCDMRGKAKGAAVAGTAVLLDPSGTAVTLVAPEERGAMKAIERALKLTTTSAAF